MWDINHASSMLCKNVPAPFRVSLHFVSGVLCCVHARNTLSSGLGHPEQTVASHCHKAPVAAQLEQMVGHPLLRAGHSARSWRDRVATVLAVMGLRPT